MRGNIISFSATNKDKRTFLTKVISTAHSWTSKAEKAGAKGVQIDLLIRSLICGMYGRPIKAVQPGSG